MIYTHLNPVLNVKYNIITYNILYTNIKRIILNLQLMYKKILNIIYLSQKVKKIHKNFRENWSIFLLSKNHSFFSKHIKNRKNKSQ